MLKTLNKTKKFNLRIIYIIFVLGLFLILNGNLVSSVCYIETSAATCTGNDHYIIMGLSDSTNAHGALKDQGTFPNVLCCDFGVGDATCTTDNKILGLSSSTNAHAEKPELSNYENSVCYDSLINCGFVSTTLTSDEIEIIGLSSDTNAHLGGFNDYKSITDNKRIVCTVTTSQVCSLTSARWQYEEVIEGADAGAIVDGTGCDGETISFAVLRRKDGPDESCSSITGCENPSNVVFGSGSNSVTGTWTAAPFHDKEYYFVAKVVTNPSETISSTPDLLVTELPPDYCLPRTICSQYEDEGYCDLDPCGVAEASVPIDIDCNDPDINCECIWEDEECKASWNVSGSDCGNGVLNSGETCDGSILDGYSCTDFDEFTGGNLLCNSQCTGFITSSCTDYSCNNDGTRDVGEACDGNNLGGFSCTNFDEFTGGDLLCNSACDFDTGQCTPSKPLCGNGVFDSGETCDGSLLDGYSCIDFDEFTGGNLLCNSQCTGFITSSCTDYSCNNDGTRDVGEACDGNNLGGFSCTNFDEFTGGDLLCNSACDFDTGKCIGGEIGAEIGTCIYTQFTDDTCDDDGFLTFSWTAEFVWAEGMGPEDDVKGLHLNCVDGQKTVECPAQIPLPFFNIYSFIATLSIIALIYVILILRKEKRKR